MVVGTLDNTLIDAGYLPLKWADERLLILDQRKLPAALEYLPIKSLEDTCFAIKDMVVRGAPSIGVTAAFGFALEACRLFSSYLKADDTAHGGSQIERSNQENLSGGHSYENLFPISSLPTAISKAVPDNSQRTILLEEFARLKTILDSTRPTAVNLRWGTDRMLAFSSALLQQATTLEEFAKSVSGEAQKILAEHIETNIKLSNFGLDVVPENANFITHCNAGPLATCGWGTALGVIRAAHAAGRNPHVYVDETRPRNQGAKLTMWELVEDAIPATLVCDNMSGFLMANKKIDLVIVGADRIARNGDAANKIGTYNLAIVANFHQVPFYVAAPLSTFDATIFNGEEIPIEERSNSEITGAAEGAQLSSKETAMNRALNPAFDVTPAHLITGIITEAGILRSPYNESIKRALGIN